MTDRCPHRSTPPVRLDGVQCDKAVHHPAISCSASGTTDGIFWRLVWWPIGTAMDKAKQ
jgi:hypothetical protein